MPVLSDFPHAFVVSTAVALGLAFGSFLNVVIYRLPRGESLAFPGSRCPACGTPIRAVDNIPVVSWLLLRGRARCCKAKIAPRYPIVEACGGLLAWAIVVTQIDALPGDTTWWHALVVFALYLALGLGLIAAAFIDLEHMLLPDGITLGGAALGLLSVPLRPDASFGEALLGALIGFVIVWLPFDVGYRALRGQAGMGLGDAKLTLLAGIWFGWRGAVFALLAGAVQGTVAALAIFVARGKIEEPSAVKRQREELHERLAEASSDDERREIQAEIDADPVATEPEEGLGKARMPFGPFLALATLEYLLFGNAIVRCLLAGTWP